MNELARAQHAAPLDVASVEADGPRVRMVDDTDPAQVAAWQDAVVRGFLDGVVDSLER
ncbi:hypothetical protein [Microbacterium sp.]|uniref:hypothetical protein n=1 Tax=Microbacterium sp. TaxID=51671 RepID=UPI0039E67B19